MFLKKKNRLLCGVLTFLLVFMSVCFSDMGVITVRAATPSLTDPLFDRNGIPQATALTTLDMRVQDTTNGDSKDAIVTARVIQGLVNRTSADKIYLFNDCTDATHDIGGTNWNVQSDWIANSDELENLPATALSRWGSGPDAGLHRLIENYQSYIDGFVIWDDSTTNYVNMGTFGAAVTIAAQEGYIAVSPTIYNEIRNTWGYSFANTIDLRQNNFASDHDALDWCIDNYWSGSNPNMKAVFSLGIDGYYQQGTGGWATTFNEGPIDYAVATNGFAFNINMADSNDDTVLMKLLQNYPEGKTAVLGWIPTHPDDGFAETPACLNGSSYYVLGGNGLSNFSVYGSFPDSSINLPTPIAYDVDSNDVYIGFMMTDGDALHCVYRGMFDTFVNNRTEDFGKIPITWSIAPQLANLAPTVYNYFVRNLPGSSNPGIDSGSDLTIGWADKVNGTGDTGLSTLADSWRQYADLSDIHTIWTVHSQENSQRADICNWNQITIGYTNSQIAIHEATLNADTVVAGTWNFGYNPTVSDAVNGIKSVVANNPENPVFMMVTIGAPFSECATVYDKVKLIADQLRAAPEGRDYHFVNARDMGATYRNYGGEGGGGGALLTNGDFELNPINANGWNTQDWNGNASFTWATDYTHGGSYSAKVGGTDINAGYNKDGATKISVSPNTTYTLTGWVKTDSVSGTGAWVWMEQQDSLGYISGTRWDSTQFTGTNDWTKVTYTFTTVSNALNMDVYINLNGSGTAWFDDLTLVQGTPANIGNGDFELNPINANSWGTQDWNSNAVFTWATDYTHGGSYAAKVSGTDINAGYQQDYSGGSQKIAISPGESYTLSVWAKTDSVSGTGAWVWKEEFDSADNLISGTRWDSAKLTGTNDWQQITYTFTSAANAAKMNLYIHLNGSGTVWYDDVTLD